jgi:hypothetical protein
VANQVHTPFSRGIVVVCQALASDTNERPEMSGNETLRSGLAVDRINGWQWAIKEEIATFNTEKIEWRE